jgi:hypothetical protein
MSFANDWGLGLHLGQAIVFRDSNYGRFYFRGSRADLLSLISSEATTLLRRWEL